MRDGSIVGAEALVRWRHPDKGLVAACEFIPVARRTGLIVALGDWVIREACREVAGWSLATPVTTPVSLNVDPAQLADPTFVDALLAMIAEYELAPANFCIEITEQALRTENAVASYALTRLRAAGLLVHVDDFGVAYSSLGRLNQLPVDVLKLDRTFVEGIDHDGRKRALAESILHVARSMALETIAEGVETEAEAAALRSMGYRVVQGYLFGRPMPGDEFAALLTSS
jgi:EAL domain-containing protein (putative c-di-GMP-specific phosphodiesterase class I)